MHLMNVNARLKLDADVYLREVRADFVSADDLHLIEFRIRFAIGRRHLPNRSRRPFPIGYRMLPNGILCWFPSGRWRPLD